MKVSVVISDRTMVDAHWEVDWVMARFRRAAVDWSGWWGTDPVAHGFRMSIDTEDRVLVRCMMALAQGHVEVVKAAIIQEICERESVGLRP